MLSAPLVTVGSRVTIKDEYGEETYGIVPVEESDPTRRAISQECPLARALLGHRAGAVVRVQAPFGTRYVIVVSVETVSEG
jgi:transcription elongation GreA/GreB family factor